MSLGVFDQNQDFICGTDGVCKPLFLPIKSEFKFLQRTINRALFKFGLPGERIGVDGIIGKASVRAAKRVYTRLPSTSPFVSAPTTKNLARFAQEVTVEILPTVKDVPAKEP